MSSLEMHGLCLVKEIVRLLAKLFKFESSVSLANSNTVSPITENCL